MGSSLKKEGEMPLYEYQCKDCRSREELFRKVKDRNRRVDCKSCGRKMERCPPSFSVDTLFPLTLEHVEPEPRTFRSRGELSRYCKEHHIESSALL